MIRIVPIHVHLAPVLDRYWDTRQPTPAHTQPLPDRPYALSVKHPLMVVGTADRNIIVYNLASPQVRGE